MYARCLPRKNRSCFWTRCSSTLILYEMSLRVEKFFSMQTQSSHQAYRNQGNRAPQSIAMSKIHQLMCNLNFFDPEHSDPRIRWSWTNLSAEVDFPALKFRVRKFSKVPFRKKEFSFNPSYHCENKFHQYDSTLQPLFGSEVKELTYSTILVSFHSRFSLLFRQYQVSFPEKRMPNSLNWWRCVEDSPSWAGGRSKNVSCNTHTILCITRQSTIAARQGTGTQNSWCMVKYVGRSRAAPWFRIVKCSGVWQGIYFVL